MEAPPFPPLPVTKERDHEKRTVSPEPGRLFRRGRVRLAITAHGVPATAKPQLKIHMGDQQLIGNELVQVSDHPPEPANEASAMSQSSEQPNRPSAVLENLLRAGARTGKKLEPTGKALLKSAGKAHKRFAEAHDLPKITAPSSQPHLSPDIHAHTHSFHVDNNQLDRLQLDEDASQRAASAPDIELSPSSPEADPSRRYSFTKHGVKKAPNAGNGNADVPERKRRRAVEFGSFEFALFHGFTPKEVCARIQDSSSHLPEALRVLIDQTFQLPDLNSLECTCGKQCNTHLLTFQMSDRGEENSKIVLRVTAEITVWSPLATDTIVTARFRELMSTIEDMADTFKDKYPKAENLTYLLVGGLFTQHYPTYFEKNKQFLQEKLRLPRVQTVPIHTEGSIARNAKIIRDSIVKTCRGSKSVVLIGHSKGGIDAVSILDNFPETKQFLFGIVSFQAPFGGTFLVDFVARSKLAVTAISSVITSLWKGDQDSLLDMSYSSRAKALDIGEARSGEHGSNISSAESKTSAPEQRLEVSKTPNDQRQVHSGEDQAIQNKLLVYKQVPIVAFGSYASFDVLSIRSAANAAGVASMAPAAQKIVKHTGFLCDGLVTAGDARIPHSDAVLLKDMMHTEPALYVQGTEYPPGQLTASALALLFEKESRKEDA